MSKKYKIREAKIVLFQDGKELTVEYPQDLRIAKEDYMYTIEFYSMDNNINIKEYLKVSKLEVHKYGKYEDDSECEIVDTYSGFESLKIIESLEFNGLKTSYKLVYNRSKSKELTDEATLKKIKDNDTFGLNYKQHMDELLKWANSSTDAETKKQAQETYKSLEQMVDDYTKIPTINNMIFHIHELPSDDLIDLRQYIKHNSK